MRWFAVIYPEEGETRACLDAMILFANPNEKDGAHITIRGPLRTRIDVERISSKIRGTTISVVGAGGFFEGRQNTVILKCGAPEMRKYWHKPDYEFNPHITIYDGPSRPFAEKLLEVLNRYRLFFTIVAGDCKLIGSSPGQKSMNLWLGLNSQTISAITGEQLDIESVASMPEWRRLTFIERICPRLDWVGRFSGMEDVSLVGPMRFSR
jgi:hypothetical protein